LSGGEVGRVTPVLQPHVAEGVHRVEDAFTNWSVLEDGDSLTVVDTGHPRSWSSLLELLGGLGRDVRAIEAVVLSHGHSTTWGDPLDQTQLGAHPPEMLNPGLGPGMEQGNGLASQVVKAIVVCPFGSVAVVTG